MVRNEWLGLQRLHAHLLVDLQRWLLGENNARLRKDGTGAQYLINAIQREAIRREWPEGWWEDPSVIPKLVAVKVFESYVILNDTAKGCQRARGEKKDATD